MAKAAESKEPTREPEFKGQLPIGLDVIFFPRGNVNADVRSASGPLAAKVCWCDENGMADLHVFDRKGGHSVMPQVYPWNHRILVDDLTGGPSGNAWHYGCWKFTSWSKEQYEKSLKLAAKEEAA